MSARVMEPALPPHDSTISRALLPAAKAERNSATSGCLGLFPYTNQNKNRFRNENGMRGRNLHDALAGWFCWTNHFHGLEVGLGGILSRPSHLSLSGSLRCGESKASLPLDLND